MKRTLRYLVVAFVIFLIVWVMLAVDEIGDYPDKIWLHRCNSIEKLMEQRDEYDNFEVDVVFRSDSVFDITHDADTTFGLSIEPYFSYIQRNGGKLWLDIKNLSVENRKAVMECLNELLGYYRLDKDRLIIESPCWRALKELTQAGYYTSLYIAWEEPSRLEPEQIDSYMAKLRKAVDKKIVKALSFPGWWYTTIKKNLNRSIDLLTWKHRTTQFELFLSPIGHEMVEDPELKVILVKDKGHYHR